jgi:hypothetical protein
MPDVVRLRYLGAEPVAVAVLGREVEPDCLLDFGGKVLDEQDDCYVIETGNPPEVRAWPKSRWANETTVKKPEE